MDKVYMDHASATPVRPEVLEAMLPYYTEYFGNPSTVYDIGSEIKRDIDEQREKVGSLIGAKGKEIIFTSSGAEANNFAIKGAALARQKKGNHIIISSMEHHSVLNSARYLERLNFEVTFLPVDKYGLIDPESLANAIRPETILVSIIHGSNEIGTIQPLKELSPILKEKEIIFHTDAVATVGNIPVNVDELGVDILSLSGVSMGAPKGIGALYFRNNLRLLPLIHGGIQENGRRAGTENVPGIIGLGKAAELAERELQENTEHVKQIRDHLISGVTERIDEVVLTGHPEKRLPGHASFCLHAIEGEALLFMLSVKGIYANTGSACASKALKTSPVLVAIGVPVDLAQGSVVFTMNKNNSIEEVDYILVELYNSVDKLRSLSPLWGEKTAA